MDPWCCAAERLLAGLCLGKRRYLRLGGVASGGPPGGRLPAGPAFGGSHTQRAKERSKQERKRKRERERETERDRERDASDACILHARMHAIACMLA